MSTLRPELPPLPPKMKHLPIDARGFPVPRFVTVFDGVPDHRVADPRAMKACIEQNRCWICGGPMGRFKAFVIGPMCSITGTVSEPPSHLECATYAATACPFLSKPHMHRRDAGLPDVPLHAAAGNPIMRNPGAVGVWVTTEHKVFRSNHGNAGALFDIGSAHSVDWFAHGRPATRAEVEEAITSGLPLIRAEAAKDGPKVLQQLEDAIGRAFKRLDEQFGETAS